MPHSSAGKTDVAPGVTVLLAVHNGEKWLDAQLDSILSQDGVGLSVVALDDASDDGSRALLDGRALRDPRLTVMASDTRLGSAAATFYALLRAIDLPAARFVAFADQDDIWHPGKLRKHADILKGGGFDGVSSNVLAFGAGTTPTLVRKDFPQREFDYLLESPGPGCTFLMSARLVDAVKELLAEPGSAASKVEFHDWLVYAVCRSLGWRWHIDSEASVDYRQHESNAFGANLGYRSAASRVSLMRSGWHRAQAVAIADICLGIGSNAKLSQLRALLSSTSFGARLTLAASVGMLRRRRRDQVIIAGLIVLGKW